MQVSRYHRHKTKLEEEFGLSSSNLSGHSTFFKSPLRGEIFLSLLLWRIQYAYGRVADVGYGRGVDMASLITMDDLSNEEILSILDDAERLLPVAKGEAFIPLLQGKMLGNLFFEPSTRTRISFELATKQLGGELLILNPKDTHYGGGGESIYDTAKVLSQYGDIVMMRANKHCLLYTSDAADE